MDCHPRFEEARALVAQGYKHKRNPKSNFSRAFENAATFSRTALWDRNRIYIFSEYDWDNKYFFRWRKILPCEAAKDIYSLGHSPGFEPPDP